MCRMISLESESEFSYFLKSLPVDSPRALVRLNFNSIVLDGVGRDPDGKMIRSEHDSPSFHSVVRPLRALELNSSSGEQRQTSNSLREHDLLLTGPALTDTARKRSSRG